MFEPRTETSLVNSAATNGLIASGSSAKSVTFYKPFFTGTATHGGSTSKYLPSIGITIQNAQTGDFFTITSVTRTGFVIEIKNGNSFANRNFSYQAVGYGKGV